MLDTDDEGFTYSNHLDNFFGSLRKNVSLVDIKSVNLLENNIIIELVNNTIKLKAKALVSNKFIEYYEES